MEWRIVIGFPNYEVSESGDVRRCCATAGFERYLTGEPLVPSVAKGYKFFKICRNGRTESIRAHRMVAEAFIGPSPFEGAFVCHNDGTRTNNHYSNLRWDTRDGNMADMRGHGTIGIGEKNSVAKLKASDISEIRRALAAGELQRTVAARYGVGSKNISAINMGKSWTHVA